MVDLQRELDDNKLKHDRILIVYKRVVGWANRALNRLNSVGYDLPEELPENLTDLIGLIKNLVSQGLGKISPEDAEKIQIQRARKNLNQIMNELPEDVKRKTKRFKVISDNVDQ